LTAEAPTAITPAVLEFLSAPGRYVTLATINRDGAPHQVLVWYLLRDDSIVLNTRIGRRWPTNALRDPRVTLTVATPTGDYMTLAGVVEPIGDRESAQDDIAAMARRYQAPELAERNIATYRTHERMSFAFHPRRVHGDSE
jgi:PPOX class probable F420-dependent enzyme